MGSENLETIERSQRAILSRIDKEGKQLDAARSELRVRQRDAIIHRLAMYALTMCRHGREESDWLGVPRFLPALLMPVPFIALAFVIGGTWLAATAAVALPAMAIGAFCYPADSKITQLLSSREAELKASVAAMQQLQATIPASVALIDQLRGQSKACDSEIEAIRNSREYALRQLFEQRWKEMRGGQFENFLAEVFSALGYEVEQTGKSGDQGVDLIVHQGGYRIAIQAKGYVDSVSNAAVQQAFTGRTFHTCDGCAVITNSRFTTSAVAAAMATGCILVHEENFEDFVFGRIQFAAAVASGGRP